MESENIQDSQALAPQLAEVRARLDGLVRELRGAEAELASLAREREQHTLLDAACGALEKLRETGGAGLFWGEREAAAAEDQLRHARARAKTFQKHVGGIEDRRRALVEQIREQEFQAGLIEDDLFEAQEEEERLLDRDLVAALVDQVEALGGTVDVQSTVGEGATFTIRLPRVVEAA